MTTTLNVEYQSSSFVEDSIVISQYRILIGNVIIARAMFTVSELETTYAVNGACVSPSTFRKWLVQVWETRYAESGY